MGHSDTHTTRRYVRVMEGKKREAVKATMFQQARVIEMPGATWKEARSGICVANASQDAKRPPKRVTVNR